MRGQYAFQTDVLISLQAGRPARRARTQSDLIQLPRSAKAAKHKAICPYLRYGFVVVGLEALGRRFLIHNEGFGFAMAVANQSRSFGPAAAQK